MESQSPGISYAYTGDSNLFLKKYTSVISFSVGLLLFFLPFVQLNCGSVTIAENSGIGLAMGTQWELGTSENSGNILKELSGSPGNSKREKVKIDQNWFIVLAILFGLAGIIFSFTGLKIKSIASMSFGILAALMLISAIIHLKILISNSLPAYNKEDSISMDYTGLIKIKFTIWYYISMAAFLIGAFFSYKHHQIELEDAIDRSVDFEFLRK